MNIEVVERPLPDFQGEAWLVRAENGKHFVVSGVSALFTGWECLVFEADEKGDVDRYVEVAGGRGMSHDEAVADLSRMLDGDGAEA